MVNACLDDGTYGGRDAGAEGSGFRPAGILWHAGNIFGFPVRAAISLDSLELKSIQSRQ